MHRPPLVACLALSACQPPPEEGDDSSTEVLESAATSTVFECGALTVTRGSASADHLLPALATSDLTGKQDVWDKYVEFGEGTEAACTFNLGTTAPSALVMKVNYRGPKSASMLWTFEAWDSVNKKWVKVGDNSFAADWLWTAKDLAVPAPVANFVSSNLVKIRYRTTSTVKDASDLDLWVLSATSS